MINDKYPTTKPSLNLDFANTKSLDPRINFRRGTPGTYYDGVTHAKAEENLLSYSEDFSQWEQNQNTIDSTLYYAPDGSQTASKIIADSTSANHWMLRDENISSGKTYTMSIYAKAAGYNYLTIFESTRFTDDSTGWVTFNLTGDGSMVYATDIVSHSITNVGNDWYRCSVTAIATSDGNGRFGIKPRPDTQGGMNPAFTGDDSSGMLFWGAQLEQRDGVTSYTATTGTPITKYQPKLMTAAADRARFDHDPITGESKGLLIEEQRTNLIEYSEDFLLDGWFKNQNDPNFKYLFIEEASTVSPGGEVDASKIYITQGMPSTGAGFIEVNFSLTDNTIYTASVYAKKAEYKKLSFQFNVKDGSYSSVAVDLNDGIISSSNAVVDSSIEHVGNGWYRIEFSFDSKSGATTPRMILQVRNDDGVANLETNKGIYIWGAQLEEGSFPTSYIKTTGASATRSADNASITGENFSSWYRQDEGSIYSEVSTFDNSNGSSRIVFSNGTYDNRFMLTNYGDNFMFTASNGVTQSLFTGPTILNKFIKKAAAFKEDDFAGSIQDFNDFTDTNAKMPIGIDRVHFHNVAATANYINGHIKKLAYYPQRLTNEQLQNLTK